MLLSKKWSQITERQRLYLIKDLVTMEKQLADLRFPAFGSLYWRSSVRETSEYHALEQDVDPALSYCIGPPCSRSWWIPGMLDPTEGTNLQGPCKLVLRRSQPLSINTIC